MPKAHNNPLQYSKIDLHITIQAGVSTHSLGTWLLQHSKPIVFDSQFLMDVDTYQAN